MQHPLIFMDQTHLTAVQQDANLDEKVTNLNDDTK